MIQIVHWQEIVGDAFLSVFTDIARNLVYAERRNDVQGEIDRIIKSNPNGYNEYREKRALMMFCGYESEYNGKTRLFYRIGWYGLPVIDGEKLIYRYVSRMAHKQEPEFISLRTFLDMKREQQEQNDEERYYNYGKVKSYIKQAVNDDFVKEEE